MTRATGPTKLLRRLRDLRGQVRPAAARLTGSLRAARWLPALGVLAAVVLAVCTNVLAARFYRRWDLSARALYSLSAATRETLRTLGEPVRIVVFLGRGDPVLPSLRHLLTAYGAETRALDVRFVDPDRDPGALLALQQEYGIAAGRTEDGRVVADAAIVIARGQKRWFVLPEDLTRIDPESGTERPRLEQALTEGIRNVLDRERASICFTSGHDEMDLDDSGPAGLSELRYRLEKNNYAVSVLDPSSPRAKLSSCRVLVVAAPDRPFDGDASKRMVRYLEQGGNVLVLSGPVLNDEYRPVASGLETIARAGGIELGSDTVVERAPELRLPGGVGERFFAQPREHPVTAGLTRGPRPDQRAFLSVAQSLRSSAAGSPTSLLETSDQAFAVTDIRRFLEGARVEPARRDRRGPLSVAMASELVKPAASSAPHGPRLVVFGSANVAQNQSFRDPVLLGNRRLTENAVSWLAAQPALVSVPDKPGAELGVALSEESLTEVWRYVMLYLPGTSLLLGALVLVRRRGRERRSRREAQQRRLRDDVERPRPADADVPLSPHDAESSVARPDDRGAP